MEVKINESALDKLDRNWYVPAVVCLGVVTATSLMVAAYYARATSDAESRVLVMDAAYKAAITEAGSDDIVANMAGIPSAPLSTSARIAIERVPAVSLALRGILGGVDAQ